MTPQEKLVAFAKSEVGYIEKATNAELEDKKANPGNANFNKYAAILDTTNVFNGRKQGADWCAIFVVCMFYLAFGLETMRKITNIPAKSMAAGVRYLRNYFAGAGGLVSYPEPGDVIFFKTKDGSAWQHTGIVTDVKNGYVYTVEGNAGTPEGVNSFVYPLTNPRIGGYGRARWDLVPAEPEPDEPAEVPGAGDDQEDKTGPSVADWSAVGRGWAVDQGVFSGDEKGDYHWEGVVTREQLAVILYNYDHRGK